MHIGLLSPSSKVYPGIGFEFMDGLKASLERAGIGQNIRFTMESIGTGGEEKAAYLAAEKLLMTESVDMLVAYIDERVLEIVKPLAYASGKLLLVINPGANHPLNWSPQENVIHLTLQQAFLCWLSGADAALKSATAGTSSTFYDCGYLHAGAIMNSFVHHGGQVVFNDVNNLLYNADYNVDALKAKMNTVAENNTLLCTSDVWPATVLYRQLAEHQPAQHLYVSPMMLQQEALNAIPASANFTVSGYQSWDTASDASANTTFGEAYAQRSKKTPTIFSLLGWETGLILHEILTKVPDNYTDGTTVVEALKKVSIDSPRGPLQLDADTLYYTSPVYHVVVAAGKEERKMVTPQAYENEWKSFTDRIITGAVSGWTNTYLCY